MAGSRLVKLNLTEPLPDSTVPVPLLRDARRAGWVTYCSICASTLYNPESPEQGRKMFISQVKTIYYSYLPIIYLWYQYCASDLLWKYSCTALLADIRK